MYRFGIGAALLASVLLLCSAIALAQEENSEVTRLLSDAKQKAAVLSEDADQLESLTHTEVSWHSHAEMLEKTKQDTNGLARVLEKLNAAHDSASPWQRQAIDRIMPLMKELASNTTAAISQLNKTKTRPTSSSYTEYLKTNSETAHDLATMIASFVRYGQTKAKFEKLSQQLELSQ
jgi:hypothetical protein